MARLRIGELLLEAGVLTKEQLDQALTVQEREAGRKLGHVLVEQRLVTETQLTQTLSRQLSVPWVSLYHVEFSRSLLSFVPRAIAEQYSLVPIFVRRARNQGETLYVAMDDPTNEVALQAVAHAAGVPVRPMIACPSDIRSAIRVYYAGEPAPPGPVTREEPSTVAGGSVLVAGPGVPSGARPAPPPPPPPIQSIEPEAAVPYDDPPTIEDAPASDPMPSTQDSPDAAPELEAAERIVHTRVRPKTLALTLLDGTTIQIPAPKKKGLGRAGGDGGGDELTARDLISALRAVAHGVDASEILGEHPRWEAMFAALLSVLLRKGLIADWEFVEEVRKI